MDAGGKLEGYSAPLPVFQGLQFGNGCEDITYLIWWQTENPNCCYDWALTTTNLRQSPPSPSSIPSTHLTAKHSSSPPPWQIRVVACLNLSGETGCSYEAKCQATFDVALTDFISRQFKTRMNKIAIQVHFWLFFNAYLPCLQYGA